MDIAAFARAMTGWEEEEKRKSERRWEAKG